MSEDRAVKIIDFVQGVLRNELQRGRITHQETIEILAVLTGDFVADLPLRKTRVEMLDGLRLLVERDVEAIVIERQVG